MQVKYHEQKLLFINAVNIATNHAQQNAYIIHWKLCNITIHVDCYILSNFKQFVVYKYYNTNN